MLFACLAVAAAAPAEMDEMERLLRKMVPEVAAEVADKADARFRKLPKVVVTTEDEERERLQDVFAEVPQPQRELLIGQLHGLYTKKDHTIRVFWDEVQAASTHTPVEDVLRCVLAHELAHALQLDLLGSRELKIYPYAEGYATWMERQVCTADAAAALRPTAAIPMSNPAMSWVATEYEVGADVVAATAEKNGPRAALELVVGHLPVAPEWPPSDPGRDVLYWPLPGPLRALCEPGRDVTSSLNVGSVGLDLGGRPQRVTRAVQSNATVTCGDRSLQLVNTGRPEEWVVPGDQTVLGRFDDVVVSEAGDGSIHAVWADNLWLRVSNPPGEPKAYVRDLFRAPDRGPNPLHRGKGGRVMVMVAAADIQPGTVISEDSVLALQVPVGLWQGFPPAFAPDQVVGHVSGFPIRANEWIRPLDDDAVRPGFAPVRAEDHTWIDVPARAGMADGGFAVRGCPRDCAWAWVPVVDRPAGHRLRHGEVKLTAMPLEYRPDSVLQPGENPFGRVLTEPMQAGVLLSWRRLELSEGRRRDALARDHLDEARSHFARFAPDAAERKLTHIADEYWDTRAQSAVPEFRARLTAVGQAPELPAEVSKRIANGWSILAYEPTRWMTRTLEKLTERAARFGVPVVVLTVDPAKATALEPTMATAVVPSLEKAGRATEDVRYALLHDGRVQWLGETLSDAQLDALKRGPPRPEPQRPTIYR